MGAAMGKLDSIMARLERMDADAARNARVQSGAVAHGLGGSGGGGVGAGGAGKVTLAPQFSRLSSKAEPEGDEGGAFDFGGAVVEEDGEELGGHDVLEESDAWMINPTKPCVSTTNELANLCFIVCSHSANLPFQVPHDVGSQPHHALPPLPHRGHALSPLLRKRGTTVHADLLARVHHRPGERQRTTQPISPL